MPPKVNLLGKVFGKLTVIAEAGRSPSGKIKWKCQCECGNIKEVISNNLLTHATESCGSCVKVASFEGKVFDKLKVVCYNGIIKRGNTKVATWVCEDAEGNQKIMSSGELTSGVRNHTIKKYKKQRAAFKTVYTKYKSKAKLAGKDFTLTYLQFENLIQQNCGYCDSAPSNTIDEYKYNGLDRIDSSKGYTKNNVEPCCIKCNRAKNDMSIPEFRQWVSKLYKSMIGDSDL